MPYIVPAFPLIVNIWRNGNPTINPPDVVSPGNLSPGKRVMVAPILAPGLDPPQLLMEVLLPKLTDVRGWNAAAGPDTVEVPSGSGRFYSVAMVDDIGKGFTNEHRFAILRQTAPWPSPIP